MTTAKSTDQSNQSAKTAPVPGGKSQGKTSSGNKNVRQRPHVINPSRTAPQPEKDGPEVQLDLFDE